MRKLLLPLALVAAAPFLSAQNCFDGDFGTRINPTTSPGDWWSPVTPIGFPFPVGTPPVTYTDMFVTDHGFVALSNGGVPGAPSIVTAYTPTAANLVAANAKVCALYADIVATGGGAIFVKSSATKCTITWRNMQNFGTPTPRFDFQLTLYPNGDFRTVFGPGVTNVSTFGIPSDNGICGATPGGGAAIPASSDLSTAGGSVDPTTYELWTVPLSFDLATNSVLFVATNPGYTWVPLGAPANCGSATNNGTGCDGMGMSAANLPTIGNSAFTFNITGVPVVSPIALVAFGTVSLPGIPIGGGCSAYTNNDIGLFTAGPVVSGASSFSFSIPANPTLVGATLAAQGAGLSLATGLGFAVSNGVNLFIGYGY